MRSASAQDRANTETQSSEAQAGTTPSVLSTPGVGFQPTMLLKPAGTRPEPAVSVPSEKRHQAGGHGDGRARARAAGDVVRIERIARHAVGRAHADQAGRELVEVGLADHDRARRDEPLHDLGRLLRLVGEARAGGGGGEARDVDIVLHRERDAEQRQVLVGPAGPARPLASRKRGVGHAADPDLVVARRGDALQHVVDDLADREAAGAVGCSEVVDAEIDGHRPFIGILLATAPFF